MTKELVRVKLLIFAIAPNEKERRTAAASHTAEGYMRDGPQMLGICLATFDQLPQLLAAVRKTEEFRRDAAGRAESEAGRMFAAALRNESDREEFYAHTVAIGIMMSIAAACQDAGMLFTPEFPRYNLRAASDTYIKTSMKVVPGITICIGPHFQKEHPYLVMIYDKPGLLWCGEAAKLPEINFETSACTPDPTDVAWTESYYTMFCYHTGMKTKWRKKDSPFTSVGGHGGSYGGH